MKNMGWMWGYGVKALTAIAFALMVFGSANGGWRELYGDGAWHDIGSGWQYRYASSVNSGYLLNSGVVRFGFDYGPGQWWHWGTTWSPLSGTGLTEGDWVGDGAWHNLNNNGWSYRYISTISGGYWNDGSITRFGYHYSAGQWWDNRNGWLKLGPLGLSQAFIGDGTFHDFGAGWSYKYLTSLSSGYWNDGSITRFGYDYGAGQWWHLGISWHKLGAQGLSQAFVGDGTPHDLLDGFSYRYDAELGAGYWLVEGANRFRYEYLGGDWYHCGPVGDGFQLATGASARFLGEYTQADRLNTVYTGVSYWYDSPSGAGYWWTGSGKRFLYVYNNGQWFHYGPSDTVVGQNLSTSGRSALFVGDYTKSSPLECFYHDEGGYRYWYYWYNLSSGIGYWSASSGGNPRYDYDYSNGQWFHYGPTDTTHQKLSADGVQVYAKFPGHYTGIGSDRLNLGNGYEYWYIMGAGEGYWSQAGADRFKYTYGAGQWSNNIDAVWQPLGSGNASAAFVGDGAWHDVGDLNFLWDGVLSYYDYDSNHYYRVDTSGAWEFRVAANASVWLDLPSGITPDGSWSPAQFVADIYPGSTDSGLWYLTVFNNTLYFSANDGTHGLELWKYDGTTASMVADIYSGTNGSYPQYLTVLNNALYFSADDGTHGYELWKYDGTTASMVADILAGPGSSGVSNLTVFDNALYFQANDGTHGYELWKYDGVTRSMVADILAGPGSSDPSFLTVFDNALYFQADDGTHGLELWKYDGVTASMVADIYSGSDSSYPLYLTVFNNALYFSANDGTHSDELWKYDGVTASMVADIYSGISGSGSLYLTVFDNALYFQAQDASHGLELWKYDGTTASMVADIYSGPDSSRPWFMTVFNNALYFQAYDGSGPVIWVMDSYGNLAETSYQYNGSPAVFDGSLYFVGYDAAHGYELWRWL